MTRLEAILGRLSERELDADLRFVCRIARQAMVVRRKQKAYFRCRTNANLLDSKAAERALDELIGRESEDATLFGEEANA